MDRGRRIIFAVILAVMLVSSAIPLGCSTGWAPARGSQIGNLAPDFQLVNLDGQSVSLRDFRGRPVLVNFWATWCPPCRAEMPFIQEVFADRKWAGKGLVILAVDIGESSSTVREFMKTYGLTFPALLDITQDVSLEYDVRAIPTSFPYRQRWHHPRDTNRRFLKQGRDRRKPQ